MTFVPGPTANSFNAPSSTFTLEDEKRHNLQTIGIVAFTLGTLFLVFVALQLADAVQPTWTPLLQRLAHPAVMTILSLLGFTLLWWGQHETDRALRGEWAPPQELQNGDDVMQTTTRPPQESAP